MMKISINRKYGLFFGISSISIMLILIACFSFIVLKKGTRLKKTIKETDALFYRENQGKTLFDLAHYLGQHLFIPVYQSDIGAVNRQINDIKLGMPFISFVVADEKGNILTDGTEKNRRLGKKLKTDFRKLKKQQIIVETAEEGERVSFCIRSNNHVAGYAQIVYSNEPLKAALERHYSMLDSGWHDFQKVLLRISAIGVAAALVLTLVLALLFSNVLSRPLIQLKQAADRVARGDLECRVQIHSQDELGELEAAFNRMVSDLQRSTQQLREANKSLKQLDRLKSDVISIVSHELRTPITSIKAFAELILMKEDMETERRKKLIKSINNESERLARLINDILDLSRIEEGKMHWRFSPLTIDEIISRGIDCLQAQADAKSIAFSARVGEGLPSFEGDRDRLIQVVTNLLSNAVKFSPNGGTIEIGAAFENTDRKSIRVTVKDHGKGIALEHLQLIFEKFHRAGDALTSGSEGSGLGLTIARSIVEHHGGRIWAESVLGAGSSFLFTLPVKQTGSNPAVV